MRPSKRMEKEIKKIKKVVRQGDVEDSSAGKGKEERPSKRREKEIYKKNWKNVVGQGTGAGLGVAG